MTKNKQTGRKTNRIVRMPATKCAHLRKRMAERKFLPATPRGR